MFPLTKYDTIAPNIVLIDQEMYELSAPENEGRVLLQHKVACEMCCPIRDSIALMKYGCEKYGKK